MIHQKQHIVPSVMSLPQQLRLTLEVEMPLLENNVLQQVYSAGILLMNLLLVMDIVVPQTATAMSKIQMKQHIVHLHIGHQQQQLPLLTLEMEIPQHVLQLGHVV